MTVHVECPCGQWSRDVEIRGVDGYALNRAIAEHAREHVAKGEPYPVPRVTTIADA